MVQLAKADGAGKVILVGRRDYPLEVGKKSGADFLINCADTNSPYYASDVAAQVKKVLNGKLATRCIVATSNMEALQNALKVTGTASTIVYFGMPGPGDVLQVPMLEAIQADRTIKCSSLAPLVWDNAFAVIASGQVDLSPIITHEFTLDKAEEALKFMRESKEDKVKGVIMIGANS